MAFLDTLASLVATVLRFFLWSVAALAGLLLISLALSALLAWMLVQRLRGRPSPVSLSARFQDLGRFGAVFGRPGFDPRMFRRRADEASPASPDPAPSALARRRAAQAVQDVQARDLPADKP